MERVWQSRTARRGDELLASRGVNVTVTAGTNPVTAGEAEDWDDQEVWLESAARRGECLTRARLGRRSKSSGRVM